MSAAALRWFRHRAEALPREALPYGARELQRLQARHLQQSLFLACLAGLSVALLLAALSPAWRQASSVEKPPEPPGTVVDFHPPLSAPLPPPRSPAAVAAVGLPVAVPDLAADSSWQPLVALTSPTSPGSGDSSAVSDERVGSVGPWQVPDPSAPVYVEEMPIAVVRVTPEYPDVARRAGLEGMVVVQAWVGIDGRVGKTRILGSQPLFDAAAQRAVESWVFRPAQLNGRPVAVWVAVPVRFSLR